MKVRLNINGTLHDVDVAPEATLLETLREELDLFGAREGCGIGMCGACTVLVDGNPISSCLMLTPQAFVDEAGYQCAFCTPGFVLTTIALLAEQPDPDDDAIREYLSGNLCRCGSYQNILRAVKACVEQE